MYKPYQTHSDIESNADHQTQTQTLGIEDGVVSVDDSSFVKNADFARDGVDLIMHHNGEQIIVEGYFTAETMPDIHSADGQVFDADLIQSFVKASPEYAANGAMSDESPVGLIQEMSGQATITRTDGSSEPMTLGTPVYQGDIIETGADSAVNIVFTDETNFAVSDNARLSIDEYVFDPATNEGTTDFSVLKGLFVFTSGLIGREDPDDVNIDTPMGSIGIRGTIIAGDTNTGEITVVEGAIVLRDFSGNEMTLANQFETAKFDPAGGKIDALGVLTANDVGTKFVSVSDVAGSLFSSINDAKSDGVKVQQPAEKAVDVDKGEPTNDTAPNKDAPKGEDIKTDAKPDQPPTKDAPAETKILDKTEAKPAHDTPKEHANKDHSAAQDAQFDQAKHNLDAKADQIIHKLGGQGPRDALGPKGHAADQGLQLSNAKSALAGLADFKSGIALFDTQNNFFTLQNTTQLRTTADLINQDDTSVTIAGGTTTTIPPIIATNYAHEEYFTSLDNTTWSYDMSLEFKGGDGITYGLTDATKAALDSKPFISSYSLDAMTGEMNIVFGDYIPTIAGEFSFSINATNDANSNIVKTYSFNLFNDLLSGFQFNVLDSDINFSSSNKKIFLDHTNENTLTISGDNNTIHMDDLPGTLKLMASVNQATVIGGEKHDTVIMKGINLETRLSGSDINLMHQDNASKFGDVLKLESTNSTQESIDFSNINKLSNVEMLDITYGDFAIDLAKKDIFDMTDGQNQLIIKGDSNDIINLDNNEGWHKIADSNQTINGDVFYEWQGSGDSSPTLLIQDTVINVNVA